jgi:hypothetical protein
MSHPANTKGAASIQFADLINRLYLRDPLKLMQVLIVSGVLLLSVFVGLLLPAKYLILPLLLMAAIAIFVLYLLYPPLGIFAVLIGGMLVPFEVGTGTETGINLAVILIPLLLGIWILDMLVRKRRISFVSSRPIWPLLALAVVSILAFGIGQLPWFVYAKGANLNSQIAGLVVFLVSVGAFLLVANLITELSWLKRLTWFFLIIGSIYMFVSGFPFLNQTLNILIRRGSNGSLLYVWFVAIALSQVLFNRDLGKFWRTLLVGLLLFTFYVSFVLQFDWKSGWVPLVAVVGVIIFLRKPRLGIILALVSLIFLRDLPSQIISTDEYSFTTRIIAWEIIWQEIVKVNPLLGLGPANYYFYTPLYPILGYSVQFNSHNNYIDIVAQIGLLGLVCFIWFAVEEGLLGLRLRNKTMDGFSQAYVIGVLGGLAGTLIAGMFGDWIIPFIYNVGVRGFRTSVIAWMFLGGLVVIEQIYSKKNQDVHIEKYSQSN